MDSAPDSYYPWFDWLRFVLANVVMLVHFGIIRGWSHAATLRCRRSSRSAAG
jgi:peptidoglycan/LPS O-acetylase OafA/YrhL